MFKFRRWWLLCGAVLVGVVALNGVVNGVVDAKAAPAPRAVCVRGGATATDGVSGRALVCVQTKVRGLRWRFQQAAVTTTTTTVPGVVAPVLVSASADDGVRVTVAGMRPDTGVYSLQWVPYGQSFNTYQMARATSASMSVPAGWFACNRTYTFRVFVMQADWQLADGHQTQNVTSHSTPFDVVMPTCPVSATPVTCATGGVCIVGDTGPGGGIVFYVQAAGGTFTCGATLASTCKYLEAATSDQSTGIVWATNAAFCYNLGSTTTTNNCQLNSVYSGDSDAQAASRTAATPIGMGMANTNQVHARLTTAGNASTSAYAAGIAYAYENNGKIDWHLPSKDELAQLYAQRTTVGGFSADFYWSSSEDAANSAWAQDFGTGFQNGTNKNATIYVRPVRAFGGTLACADGGVCIVGDTGPGGGIVFYVASGTFTQTGAAGSMCTTACKYLEAAPTNWLTGTTGDPQRTWATNVNANQTTAVSGADGTAIGSGYQNSLDIVAQAGNVAASSAAVLAREYGGGGKTDWFLPSKDELNQMCKWQRGVAWISDATVCTGGTLNSGTGASGFWGSWYWSSSELADSKAWSQSFSGSGSQSSDGFKDNTLAVRPVRAFG